MGYLLEDNKASGGQKEEYDTKSCRHCGGVLRVFRPPYTHQHTADCQAYGCNHEQFYCSRCDGMLCRSCGRKSAKTGTCDIFKAQMEKVLAKLERDRMWSRIRG